MFRFRRSYNKNDFDLLNSELFDQNSFYPAFIADATRATRTIIIESPFIGYRRLGSLLPVLEKAIRSGVRVVINTRDPSEHNDAMRQYATQGITAFQSIGVEVLYTGGHHRKLAMVDNRILWEGSLNILSQSDSCEVMRRVESAQLTEKMIAFTGLAEWYTRGTYDS